MYIWFLRNKRVIDQNFVCVDYYCKTLGLYDFVFFFRYRRKFGISVFRANLHSLMNLFVKFQRSTPLL